MSRTRALALAAVLVAAFGPFATAQAEPRGSALRVVDRCDADLTILPAPGLSGEIALSGPVHSYARGDSGEIEVEPGCRGGDALVIQVPPDFPVTVEGSGGGTLHLGDLQGPVSITLSGDGDTTARHLAGNLSISTHGSGDIAIAAMTGNRLAIDVAGGGDVNIADIGSDEVAIQGAGSGDIAIGPGRIRKLAAELAGSGDLSVRATVNDGAVRSMGSADIEIARVTGHLERSTSGSGSIRVAQDGTAGAGDSFVMPPMPLVPEMPVIPPIRMPSFQGGHQTADDRRAAPPDETSNASGSADRSGPGVVTPVLALGATCIVGLLAWRRRDRIASRVRTLSPSARGTPIPASRNPSIAALALRLETLAQRIGRLETWVTTKEFELHRGFREIGDD